MARWSSARLSIRTAAEVRFFISAIFLSEKNLALWLLVPNSATNAPHHRAGCSHNRRYALVSWSDHCQFNLPLFTRPSLQDTLLFRNACCTFLLGAFAVRTSGRERNSNDGCLRSIKQFSMPAAANDKQGPFFPAHLFSPCVLQRVRQVLLG